MFRNIMIPCITLTLLVPVGGCDDTSVVEGAPQDAAHDVVADNTVLEELAWRYLYEELATPADAEPIFAAIRDLDIEDQHRFHDLVIDLQLADIELTDELRRDIEVTRSVSNARLERGLDLIDVKTEELDAVVAEVVASLSDELKLPRASCSTVPFPYSVTEKTTCPASSIGAYAFDRRENDAVAYPDCDYRYRFSTSSRRYNVAGINPATVCALSHNNGALLSSYSSGTQHVLMGYNWLHWCNLWKGDNVTSGLRIY